MSKGKYDYQLQILDLGLALHYLNCSLTYLEKVQAYEQRCSQSETNEYNTLLEQANLLYNSLRNQREAVKVLAQEE
jgi:hypothetical protein